MRTRVQGVSRFKRREARQKLWPAEGWKEAQAVGQRRMARRA